MVSTSLDDFTNVGGGVVHEVNQHAASLLPSTCLGPAVACVDVCLTRRGSIFALFPKHRRVRSVPELCKSIADRSTTRHSQNSHCLSHLHISSFGYRYSFQHVLDQ